MILALGMSDFEKFKEQLLRKEKFYKQVKILVTKNKVKFKRMCSQS